MMEEINGRVRHSAYGHRIERTQSPLLAYSIPIITILLGSLSPLLPVIASAPLLPPLGYLFFLSWRLVRPGLLPLWAGIPFGLFDDLFSGQPLGSAIMLWSLTMLALEVIDNRYPWRNFVQDWLLSIVFIAVYLVVSALVAGFNHGGVRLELLLPQFIFSILLYPIVAFVVGSLDNFRLRRVKRTA